MKPVSFPLLAVETSCDETSAAVLGSGYELLAHEVYSQLDEHAPYGGVVPELASREHSARLPAMVERVLAESGVEPRAIAVTVGPGLIGSLLVGVSFAKAWGYARNLPVHPVHHVAGHIAAIRLSRDFPPPFLALVASGGHTELVLARSDGSFQRVARTMDDAAGEAFDKAARLLEAGYPGGPMIERLAARAEGEEKIRLSGPLMSGSGDFSFSGLKTALKNRLASHPIRHEEDRCALAAAFQREVVESLVAKSMRALDETGANRLLLTGGVAANRFLRARLEAMAHERGVEFAAPELKYCTDNAAMIAAAAAAYPTRPMSLDETARPSIGLNDLEMAA